MSNSDFVKMYPSPSARAWWCKVIPELTPLPPISIIQHARDLPGAYYTGSVPIYIPVGENDFAIWAEQIGARFEYYVIFQTYYVWAETSPAAPDPRYYRKCSGHHGMVHVQAGEVRKAMIEAHAPPLMLLGRDNVAAAARVVAGLRSGHIVPRLTSTHIPLDVYHVVAAEHSKEGLVLPREQRRSIRSM